MAKFAFHIELKCSSDPNKHVSEYGIIGSGSIDKYRGSGRTQKEFMRRLRNKFDRIAQEIEERFDACGEGCLPFLWTQWMGP